MNLSDHSSEVVGFDSTWDREKQVLVKDSGTEAMESQVELKETFTSTTSTSEIGVQTTAVVLSNSNEETDKKLAAWLKKIMPALEKELADGPTPVYGNDSQSNLRLIKIDDFQDIDMKHHLSTTNLNSDEFDKGAATWLSVSTQDSPVLVVSCSSKSGGQNQSFIVVLEPTRSKTDPKVYWQELVTIPVKEPIEYLTTNLSNRDMFAGGSASGDLYIWCYQSMPSSDNDSRVIEYFSTASDDSIVGLTFLSSNRLLSCQSDGKIVVYKVINKQNTVVDKIMKIEPRNMKDPLITKIVSISDAEDDFALGLLNGSVLYCSTNQLMPQDGPFNPIVRELQAHKFAISSLRYCVHNKKPYVLSCDLSGEIFVHEIEDSLEKQPKLVVKLPLPLKNVLACRNNLEHIFCPLDKGSLEVFRTSINTRETLMEGKLNGTGNIIELSKNESWLVTGIYNGTFKIFHLMYDE